MRKRTGGAAFWGILCAVCGTVAVVLLCIDAFFVSVPAWIELVVVAGLVFSLIRFLRLGKEPRKPYRILAASAAVIVAVFSLYGCLCSPYWNSVNRHLRIAPAKAMEETLRADEARADLVCMYHKLMRTHPNLYGLVPEEIAAAMQDAHNAIRAAGDELTVAQTARILAGVLSCLQDAHTTIGLNQANSCSLKSADEHALAGDRLVAVNGVPLEEMLGQYADILSVETESQGLVELRDCLSSAAGLAFLGLSPDETEYIYVCTDGRTITEVVDEGAFVPSAVGEPADHGFVSYAIDGGQDLAVLTLTECVNNAEYRQCLERMFTDVRDRGIQHLALDLRGNGGGDSSVIGEFVRYLDIPAYRQWAWDKRLGLFMLHFPEVRKANMRHSDLAFDGNLYVLIGPETFGAGMLFAEVISDNDLGAIIGEAPGGSANGHGDPVVFQLPHSGLLVRIAGSSFFRMEDEKGSILQPDILCSEQNALEVLHRAISPEYSLK